MARPIIRCAWAPAGDALYEKYHDEEWGVPVHDDRKMFEFMVLESAQAGLSWRTILAKRENYRKAFAGFDPKKVTKFTARDVARLMNDAGIVRNRQKIMAAINNAKRFIELQKEFGSFCNYLWSFVDGKPKIEKRKTMRDLPAKTSLSEALAKDLKKRGFQFFGPVVCYAHMQAVGIVNDHVTSCLRHRPLASRASSRRR